MRPPKSPPKTDGRNLRRERSRASIARAMVELIEEGDPAPTAERVAQQAGVSRRLVFELFRDIDSLMAEVAMLQWTRVEPLLSAVPVDLPFEERLRRFVVARVRLYEVIAPMRRAVLLREPFHEALAEGIRALRQFKRLQAVSTFEPELARLAVPARKSASELLGAVTSFSFWSALRDQQGLSLRETEVALEAAVRSLLAPASRR